MKLDDFRFVERDKQRILQVRHRKLVLKWADDTVYLASMFNENDWTDWEDVPLVAQP